MVIIDSIPTVFQISVHAIAECEFKFLLGCLSLLVCYIGLWAYSTLLNLLTFTSSFKVVRGLDSTACLLELIYWITSSCIAEQTVCPILSSLYLYVDDTHTFWLKYDCIGSIILDHGKNNTCSSQFLGSCSLWQRFHCYMSRNARCKYVFWARYKFQGLCCNWIMEPDCEAVKRSSIILPAARRKSWPQVYAKNQKLTITWTPPLHQSCYMAA
jgi:hypothetical protein